MYCFSLCNKYFFSDSFQDFFITVFTKLIMACLGMVYFMFLLLESYLDLGDYGSLSIRFGKIVATISSLFFSVLPSSPLCFLGLWLHIFLTTNIFLQVTDALFLFFFFPVFGWLVVLFYIVSIAMSSSSLMFSSVTYDLLLTLLVYYTLQFLYFSFLVVPFRSF